MKTLILTAILTVLVFNGSAHSDDWDGDDKDLHFIAGAVLGGSGYAIHDIVSPNSRERDKFLTGWLLGTSIGLSKELLDQYRYGGFSYKDFLVTSAGSALGSLLGVGIVYVDNTLFLRKEWRW